MTEKLIENWNAAVGKNDEIYHLGDFAFASQNTIKKILEKLNGFRKYLIFGNHDKAIRKNQDIQKYFVWCKDYHEMWINDSEIAGSKQFIVLCHYPFKSFNGSNRGAFNLFGHCHNKLPDSKLLSLDVGVDANNYKPISYNQIKEIMRKKSDGPTN